MNRRLTDNAPRACLIGSRTRKAHQHRAQRPPPLPLLYHVPTGITSLSNTGCTCTPAHPARPVSGGPETALTSAPESNSAFSNVMVGALTLF